MWLEIAASVSFFTSAFCAEGWRRTRRRLAESARDREDLANSSLVIEEERKMLELVAKGAPLSEVLNTLTLAIENISQGALCTVMLLDERYRKYLSVASGPGLPKEYLQALNGLEIGPDVGACGSAAFRNETVVVEDISTDYRFTGARDFVLGHGLHSCWSQPIRDSRNSVLGTFAIYHRHIAKPRSEELRMARVAAQLAGNAIERIRAGQALKEATRRLSLAERVARFGIWESDFDRSMLTISEGMAALLELPAGKLQLTTAEFDAFVHPEDLKTLQAAFDPSKLDHGTYQSEYRIVLPSGSVRWVRSQWRYELAEGRPTLATGATIDITEERNILAQSHQARSVAEASARAARKAERLEQHRKAILEMVAKDQPLEQIVTAMADSVASRLPGSLCSIRVELTDAPPISVYPRFPESLAAALDRIPTCSIHQTLKAEPVGHFSSDPEWPRLLAGCGISSFVYYRAAPIFREKLLAGMIVTLVAEECQGIRTHEKLLESWAQFASLAVERRGVYEALSFRARYDSLTSLLNRASLYDRLEAEIGRSDASGAAMAIVYIDVDNFKSINDRYGHATGDQVLRDTSRRILESIRHTDIAARIGGDEFVAILPGVGDRGEAARVASLVASAIEHPRTYHGSELRVGASFGVSIYPADGTDADALLKIADEEMYVAKIKGRSPRMARGVDAMPVSDVSRALLSV